MFNKNENVTIILYLLEELSRRVTKLSNEELTSLKKGETFPKSISKLSSVFERRLFQTRYPIEKNKIVELDNYSFDVMMNNIRNAVMHNKITENDDLSSIEWILKFLLASGSLFNTVREMDNFLSNITGFKHKTRSTGRDRIINWYFKEFNDLRKDEKNRILFEMTKYIFGTYYSDYKKWFQFLSHR